MLKVNNQTSARQPDCRQTGVLGAGGLNIRRGFTLLEILIVLAIIAVVSAISFFAFSGLQKNRILDKEAGIVISVLEEARSLTLASKESSRYGVFFSPNENKIVLFRGNDFISGVSTNKEYFLNNTVSISEINLIGEDADQIVFKRLSGETDQYGTIVLSLTSDLEQTAIISVYPTGIIERLE